jgi:cyclase
MLRPRIIPCLLVHKKGLVKTVNFKNSKYVGDPINAVKIFNEKEVDELMVLDIDASVEQREPDYKMIENIARECRMPLCYGGGIKTAEQAGRIFSLGVEKIAISSAAVENTEIVSAIAQEVGRQSVVIVLDIKRKLWGGFELYINNATQKIIKDIPEFITNLQKLGAGEIVINSIDNDGTMQGYNLDLIDKIMPVINVPLTVIGGAGSLEDIKNVIAKYKLIGIGAGSLFVFKGKFRAVLINYPNGLEKEKLFE